MSDKFGSVHHMIDKHREHSVTGMTTRTQSLSKNQFDNKKKIIHTHVISQNIQSTWRIETDLGTLVCRPSRSSRLDKCHRSSDPVMVDTAQWDMLDSWSHLGSCQGSKILS